MFRTKNKNKHILLHKSNKRKKKTKIKNYKNIYISLIIFISLIISILIIFHKKFLFFLSKEQITNDLNNFIYKVFYYNNKIYWENKTSINYTLIKKELKEFKNISLSFKNPSDYIKRKHPKVSIIITIHNQEKNIKAIYYSIQKQELKDIEIIFIDDASTDNSALIIKSLKEKDNRIIYLKNEINKRALYSRNRGILNAKGEYIIVIDPDDLLINNILIKAYAVAKKFDLDMVQFYALIGAFPNPILWSFVKHKSGIIKNNSNIRNNFVISGSRNLWDKLVRRETYIKSIKFMKEEFMKEMYYINNDDTSSFGLIHVTESYGFLEDVGYFYILKPGGTYNYRYDTNNANLIFNSIINNMKYFYLQSDDNALDKNNFAFKYFKKMGGYLNFNVNYLTNELNFKNVFDVINLYLNSTYFDDKQKKKINELKMKIINRTNQIKINKNNFSVNYSNISFYGLNISLANESKNYIL